MLLFPDNSKEPPIQMKWQALGILACVFGAFFRLYWLFFEHPPKNYIFSDMQVYVDTAMRLLEPGYAGRIDDTIHPPAMSYLVALMYRLDSSWILFTALQFFMS